MRTKLFRKAVVVMAGTVTAWLAAVTLQAQPMYDRIHVNLPYTVTLQNKTLQPGDYIIQQLPSTGDSRVLLFYSKDGMKFETSAMTIPALDPATARDTKLILNQVGSDYYINKIWVQGKSYGYQLPEPDSFKAREKERVTESSVAATYQSTSSTDVTATTNTDTQTVASTATAPPAEANSNNTADTANRPLTDSTASSAASSTTTTTETAQSTPPPAQPLTPPPAADNSSADRAMPDQTPAPAPASTDSTSSGSANREMPSTAADWMTMLLSGGMLTGAGLMLRRRS